tara:strand:- start:22370 stop:22546 length:177 start_codon:yes stop_codon:yes gene_type:complete
MTIKNAPKEMNQNIKKLEEKKLKTSFWKRIFSYEIDDRKIDEIKRENELKFMRMHFLG